MVRITEQELIIPALLEIVKNGGEISTTQLIEKLRNSLNPQGEDLEILQGRNDDKFSQKVRNLISHKTLEGYVLMCEHNYMRITDTGKEYVRTLGF